MNSQTPSTTLETFNILDWTDRLEVIKESAAEIKATCPVCGGSSLKINKRNGAYQCWTGGCEPKLIREAIRPLKEALGDEPRDFEQEKRDRLRRQKTQKEKARKEAQVKRGKTKRINWDHRNQALRQWLSGKKLTFKHRENLRNRGLSDAQIDAGMFRSEKTGIICPVWFGDRMAGYQRRSDEPDRAGGKYLWGTWECRLDSGEMPIAAIGESIDGVANLAEGILKPFIAQAKHEGFWVGAAGANFRASGAILLKTLQDHGIKKIHFWADSKGRSNQQVFKRDNQTLRWLEKKGFEIYVADYGQLDGQLGDCDEIDPKEIRPHWLTLKEYSQPPLLTYPTTVKMNQQYLGKIHLPNSGLVAIASNTGTGKTDSVAEAVQDFIKQGRRVIIISNRVTTSKELATRFKVSHSEITEGDKKELAKAKESGLAICIESCKPFGKGVIRVTRIGKFGDIMPSDWLNDAVVILDEFDQVSAQMLGGATCRKDRGYILSTFKGLIKDVLCRSNGLVVAMSADLSDNDIDFLVTIAREESKEIKPHVIRNTWVAPHKYDAYIYKSKESVLARAMEILATKPGDKCLFFSVEGAQACSKWGTASLAKVFQTRFPLVRILVYDQKTMGIKGTLATIEHINKLAASYDIILSSTSISSAVSLNEPGRWIAVCDISAGLVHPREYRQRLDRVREGVDRHLYIPKATAPQANGATEYEAVEAGKKREIRSLMNILKDADFNIDKAIDPICFRTWAKQVAAFNQASHRYRDAVIELLQSEGVNIFDGDDVDDDTRKQLSLTVREARDENWQVECESVSKIELISEEEFEWIDAKAKRTENERLKAERFKVSQSFGGIETLSPELVKKNHKGVRSKWRLHFYLLFNKFAIESDRRQMEAKKRQPIIHAPDIRSYSAKYKLLQELGIPKLMQTEEELCGSSPLIQAIAIKAWAKKQEIKDILGVGLAISPIQVVQSLLGTIDCRMKQAKIRREGTSRVRYYNFVKPDDERWEVFDRWADNAVESVSEVATSKDKATENVDNLDHPFYKKDLYSKGDRLSPENQSWLGRMLRLRDSSLQPELVGQVLECISEPIWGAIGRVKEKWFVWVRGAIGQVSVPCDALVLEG